MVSVAVAAHISCWFCYNSSAAAASSTSDSTSTKQQLFFFFNTSLIVRRFFFSTIKYVFCGSCCCSFLALFRNLNFPQFTPALCRAHFCRAFSTPYKQTFPLLRTHLLPSFLVHCVCFCCNHLAPSVRLKSKLKVECFPTSRTATCHRANSFGVRYSTPLVGNFSIFFFLSINM